MSHQRNTFCYGTLTMILALSTSMIAVQPGIAVSDSDWPSYRGHRGDGISTGTSVFPESGKFALSVAWKMPAGSGYSGIAVAEGVAITMFADGEHDVIAAFDIKTGAEQWRKVIDKTYIGHDGSHTGPISTPLIANGHVYGLTPRGQMFARNIKTGTSIWVTDLVKEYEAAKPHYGFSTSPFLRDGVLIIQGGAKDAAVTGFDPATGKLLWKSGEDVVAYQSPIDYRHNDKDIMLASGNKKLIAFVPKTGDILWTIEHDGSGATGSGSLSPIPVGDDRIFLAHKSDAGALFNIKGATGAFETKPVWESNAVRNSYNVPVCLDGHIYAYSSRFLTCVNAATGDPVWKSRDPGDGFLIAVDGHLVIVTKRDGGVFVVKASPSGYTPGAHVAVMGDGVWAHPSYADGSIFVRSMSHIARVDINRGSSTMAGNDLDRSAIGHGRLSRFIAEVAKADNKSKIVDTFMSEIKSFPLVDGHEIHFLYRGPGKDVAVGSDLFGARQESAMKRVEGTNLFYLTVEIERDARANYIFIRDFEDHITDPLNPRKTLSSIYGQEMAMNFGGTPMEMSWFSMPLWKAPTFFETPDESRVGKIESHNVDSAVLGDGKTTAIDVYLPASYAKGDGRFPVAYVHGGAAAMDRGEMPRALDNLIGKSVRPVIVVFLKPAGRMQPDQYMAMFTDEIVPYVDDRYRTIKSPQSRASIGIGFQGQPAMAIAFSKPELIGKVATESLFMFNDKQLKSLIKTAKEQPIELFMEWAKYDLRNPDEAWDLAQTNRDFAAYLKERGFDLKGGELNEGTGWSTWKNRTGAIFTAMYPINDK